MAVGPKDDFYLQKALAHLEVFRSINIYHYFLINYRTDYNMNGVFNKNEFWSMVNRIRTRILEDPKFIEDSVIKHGFYRIRYNPNYEHEKNLIAYARQQRNVAWAIGFFTLVTTATSVITCTQTCGKPKQETPKASIRISLSSDSTSKSQTTIDSPRLLTGTGTPKTTSSDSLPSK